MVVLLDYQKVEEAHLSEGGAYILVREVVAMWCDGAAAWL